MLFVGRLRDIGIASDVDGGHLIVVAQLELHLAGPRHGHREWKAVERAAQLGALAVLDRACGGRSRVHRHRHRFEQRQHELPHAFARLEAVPRLLESAGRRRSARSEELAEEGHAASIGPNNAITGVGIGLAGLAARYSEILPRSGT